MNEGTTLDPRATDAGGVLDEWGRWLDSRWRWDWFATLTFDQSKAGTGSHDVVGWSLSRRYWDEWATGIAERAGLPGIYWFRGREPNKNNRGTHFHALIGGVEDLRRSDAWSAWSRHGFARILPYGEDHEGKPLQGAARYVSKYVVKELGDLEFSPDAGLYMRFGANDR